jgi:hypothetical protein
MPGERSCCGWVRTRSSAAVRLSGPADQPLLADGRVVTFWELISEQAEYGTVAELAVLLRRLQDLEPPGSLALPELRPFARVDGRIDGADLAEDDRAFPRARLAGLREQYAGLDFVLSAGPVHGDASIGNIIRQQSDGVAVLIDLDGSGRVRVSGIWC